CAGATSMLFAQGRHHPADEGSEIDVPDSSVEHAGEHGVAAHTNHLIRIHPGFTGTAPAGETPSSIASVYNLTAQLAGSSVIAIVDAFHYPTALNDFNVFASQFGLATETSTSALSSSNKVFQVVYATGSRPRANCGWAQEAALDIEWAHAMAPNAKIVLVEAQSNSFSNLLAAVDLATAGSQVSMSWGGSEFSSEASYDTHFADTKGIVF